MSADNGVYILRTYTHYVKKGNSVTYVKEKFPVWRVAYASAIDNLDHYKKYQPENVGAYLHDTWKDSEVNLTEDEAFHSARSIANGLQAAGQYLEYGIVMIKTDYTFYKD